MRRTALIVLALCLVGTLVWRAASTGPRRASAPVGATPTQSPPDSSGRLVVSFDRQPTTEGGGHRIRVRAFEGSSPWVEGQFEPGTNECRFERLPPGEYYVLVTVGNDEVLEAEDVVVRSGRTTRDPRLTEVTLSTLAHEITIEVVDEDGSYTSIDVPGARPRVTIEANGQVVTIPLTEAALASAIARLFP